MSATTEEMQLFQAAENGNVPEMERLLAIPSVQAHAHASNNRVLLDAVRYGYLNIIKRLMALENVQKTGRFTEALEYAATRGHTQVVRFFLEMDSVKASMMCIHMLGAVEKGHLEVVNCFLETEKGQDMVMTLFSDETKAETETAFTIAARANNVLMIKRFLEIEKVRNKLKHMADFSGIKIAAKYGRIEALQLLLATDEIKNHPNIQISEALLEACKHGHVEVVNCLLAHGDKTKPQKCVLIGAQNQLLNYLQGAVIQGSVEIFSRLLQETVTKGYVQPWGGSILRTMDAYNDVITVKEALVHQWTTRTKNNTALFNFLSLAAKHGHLSFVYFLATEFMLDLKEMEIEFNGCEFKVMDEEFWLKRNRLATEGVLYLHKRYGYASCYKGKIYDGYLRSGDFSDSTIDVNNLAQSIANLEFQQKVLAVTSRRGHTNVAAIKEPLSHFLEQYPKQVESVKQTVARHLGAPGLMQLVMNFTGDFLPMPVLFSAFSSLSSPLLKTDKENLANLTTQAEIRDRALRLGIPLRHTSETARVATAVPSDNRPYSEEDMRKMSPPKRLSNV